MLQQPPLADLTLQSATAPTLPPPLCFEPPAATPAAALSRRAAQDASGRPVWTGTIWPNDRNRSRGIFYIEYAPDRSSLLSKNGIGREMERTFQAGMETMPTS